MGTLTRRQLGARLLAAPLLAALTARRALAEGASFVRGTFPMGELEARIRLTAERILRGGPPAFTAERIVADAAGSGSGESPEESGDLAGRYLGAMSLLPPDGLDLRGLTRDVLAQQRPDGRFGNADLRFAADAIGPAHLALVRGNGRLLVGLLEFAESGADAPVMASARRLGDFLVGLSGLLESPEQSERLRRDANVVSLTQLSEGFVLLAEATGEARYSEAARRLAAVLGPRGTQSAHGYLTTLRGIARLAAANADLALQRDVESRYRELVASRDWSPYGGVLEYFGWDDPDVPEADRRRLREASPAGPRDEGCATADFLRLSLQLWRATGTMEYLERAERCLLNHFFFDQLGSGDFGPRAVRANGFEPTEAASRSWWCCTLHGYRTFRDALDHLVRRDGDTTFVDFFQDADVTLPGITLALRHRSEEPGSSRFSVEVIDASNDMQGVAVRRPSWAASILVLFGDHKVSPRPGPYVIFKRRWRPGESMELVLEHAVRLETRDGRSLGPSALGTDTEGLLFVGPWLMAADDVTDPALFSGPRLGEGTVLLPPTLGVAQAGEGEIGLANRARHLRLRFLLGGQRGPQTLTLRPLAEQTTRLRPGLVAAWLRYRSPH
jgi:hypothetical protein